LIAAQKIVFSSQSKTKCWHFYSFQQNATPELKEASLTHAELVKHPLQHSWCLWYYEPDRNKSWEDNQNQVSTFNSVEDFWSLFTHIKQPSEVKIGSDYSLFKDQIRPMWEDKANKNGGRWMIGLNRNQRPELDRYWIDTVRRNIWFRILGS
jgi:Eukaryotic initiation factor 4E